MALDRNAANSQRLRRNQQRARSGGLMGDVTVAAPLENTGTQIQLNLDSAGGLENNSGNLRVKTRDTSMTRDASGIGVALRTASGLQISSGLGILLNGGTLALAAGGLSVANGGIGAAQLGVLTTKGDLLAFSTLHTRVPVGANNTALFADSTQAAGVRWGVLSDRFVFNEVPTGTVDGVNAAFTLANTPVAGTVQVFKSGLLQTPTTDYTVSGTTVTFVVAPAGGSVLLVHYMK